MTFIDSTTLSGKVPIGRTLTRTYGDSLIKKKKKRLQKVDIQPIIQTESEQFDQPVMAQKGIDTIIKNLKVI